MRVFVAGATGDIGLPVVRRLVAGGHEVTGLTRHERNRDLLSQLGAASVVGSVLDSGRLRATVESVRPEAVIDLLTALPRSGPRRPSHLRATNEVRARGTPALVAAARDAGARRYVAESVVFGYGYGDHGTTRLTEDDRDDPEDASEPALRPALRALRTKEEAVLGSELEGVVLRYGVFYGPHVGSTRLLVRLLRMRVVGLPGGGPGVLSWIHIEDAADATVAALHGGAAANVYNIVDDEPVAFRAFTDELARLVGAPRPYGVPVWLARPFASYAATFMARTRLAVSNEKAKRELGWTPRFPTYREGLADVAEKITDRRSGR